MFSTSKSLVVVFVALASVACTAAASGDKPSPTPPVADDAGPSPTPLDGATFCSTYCAKVSSCDNTIDEQTCEEECKNANAAIIPKYRTDVMAGITQCVDATDCKTVLAGSAVSKCVDETAASIAPDAAATSACSALASEGTKCHATFNRSLCLESAKMFNDAALATASKCGQKACTDVDACLKAAVGGSLGYESAASCSSVGDGKAFDWGTTTCNSCMSNSCCSASSRCAANTSCASLVYCASQCTTDSCVDACASRYPSGLSDANAMLDCADTSCSSACN